MMTINSFVPVFSAVAAAYATPLIISLWSRLSPPAATSAYDAFTKQQLFKRNNWINNIATVFSLAGIGMPVVIYANGVSSDNPWPLGLGFGLMVILPVTCVALITIPKGLLRHGEFWRYYELKYKISLRSILFVYWLVGLLGVVSAYQLMF
ncbi:MAG: hypothetical protein OEY11_08485 [Gammaproteobacteria bacterium]|nr:hypothetical protein [Gammaproteobacteria bacterium]